MECKCTLTDVTRDWATGKLHVTFEAEDDISGQIDSMRDKTLRLTAKQWRDKLAAFFFGLAYPVYLLPPHNSAALFVPFTLLLMFSSF